MPKRTEDGIEVGARFKNNQGDQYTLVSVDNLKNIGVVFDNYPDNILYTRKSLILEGFVKNHYKPSLHGVGYIGVGKFSAKSNSPQHNVWSKMIARCYDKTVREFNRYGGRGVYVHKDWHNFQIFHDWFDKNYVEGYQLDKDLKNPDNLVYSPDTCIFIPSPVNKILISNNKFRSEFGVGVHIRPNGKFQASYGCFSKTKTIGTFNSAEEAFSAYKEAKESHIKVVADLYKDVLPVEAYHTLMNWEVLRFPE